MAKYNWQELEKEYLLSDYNSVSSFLKAKKIPLSGSAKKSTTGWKEKKVQKEKQKSTKTIEKVIEKESEKEANKIVTVKSTAEELLKQINISMSELNKYIAKSKKKVKKVKYDNKVGKPSEEVTEETEEVSEYISIIDRFGLKQLTSALKDLDDILTSDNENNQNNNDGILNELIGALKNAKDNK